MRHILHGLFWTKIVAAILCSLLLLWIPSINFQIFMAHHFIYQLWSKDSEAMVRYVHQHSGDIYGDRMMIRDAGDLARIVLHEGKYFSELAFVVAIYAIMALAFMLSWFSFYKPYPYLVTHLVNITPLTLKGGFLKKNYLSAVSIILSSSIVLSTPVITHLLVLRSTKSMVYASAHNMLPFVNYLHANMTNEMQEIHSKEFGKIYFLRNGGVFFDSSSWSTSPDSWVNSNIRYSYAIRSYVDGSVMVRIPYMDCLWIRYIRPTGATGLEAQTSCSYAYASKSCSGVEDSSTFEFNLLRIPE